MVTHQFRDAVAQAQVLLHGLATQVEVAVLQADVLVDDFVVELERRGQRGVENLQRLRKHFDHAGGQVGVLGAGGTRAHAAVDFQDKFGADFLGKPERIGGVGVDHHLHHALAVPEVDEDDAAVVAPTVRPAAQGDALADVGGRHAAAIMSTHDESYWVVGRGSPETTPIEMMYLSARSTEMSSSMTSLRLT